MSGDNVPREAIRDMIASAIDLIVHLQRAADGTRRIASISQLKSENGVIVSTEVFQALGREDASANPIEHMLKAEQ